MQLNSIKMELTNLTSSSGSAAFRIRTDSSIILIWSGVYLTATQRPQTNNLSDKLNTQLRKNKKQKKKPRKK